MSAPPVAAPAAGDLLTRAELQALRRTSTARGAWLVLHAWAVILGAMAACALWPSPLMLLAAIAAVGGRQLGLTVLAHEAAHWRLFYHLEHHLLVFVPCWRLRAAHVLLLARGLAERMEVAAGYWEVVRRATSAPATALSRTH